MHNFRSENLKSTSDLVADEPWRQILSIWFLVSKKGLRQHSLLRLPYVLLTEPKAFNDLHNIMDFCYTVTYIKLCSDPADIFRDNHGLQGRNKVFSLLNQGTHHKDAWGN
jgi:hypothetical protein